MVKELFSRGELELDVGQLGALIADRQIAIAEAHEAGLRAADVAHKLKIWQAILTLPIPPQSKNRKAARERTKYLLSANDAAVHYFAQNDLEACWKVARPFFQYADECAYLADLHAALLVREGRLDEAIEQVRVAVTAGFRHTEDMRVSPDLAPLHADPRFQEIFRSWDEGGFIEGGYAVDVARLTNPAVPPLLRDFARWLRKQPYGSVGYFEFRIDDIPMQLIDDEALRNACTAVLTLGEGSLIALHQNGSVILLDSEGAPPRILGETLDGFLSKLAQGQTGNGDLDAPKADRRPKLKAWLEART